MAKKTRRNARPAPDETTETEVIDAGNVGEMPVTATDEEEREEEEEEEEEDDKMYARRTQANFLRALSLVRDPESDKFGKGYVIPKKTVTFEAAKELIDRYIKDPLGSENIDIEKEIPGGSWVGMEPTLPPEKIDYEPIIKECEEKAQAALEGSTAGRYNATVILNVDGRTGAAKLLAAQKKLNDNGSLEINIANTMDEKLDYARAYLEVLKEHEVKCELIAYNPEPIA